MAPDPTDERIERRFGERVGGEAAAPGAQRVEDRAPPGAGGARCGVCGDGKRNGAHGRKIGTAASRLT